MDDTLFAVETGGETLTFSMTLTPGCELPLSLVSISLTGSPAVVMVRDFALKTV